MAFVDFNPPTPMAPLIPTGSLIQTNSKFGHELIAGPLIGRQQVVGHKEPGNGVHLEWIDRAAQRYQFTGIIAPVNNDHGAVSWQRLVQQLGDQWGALDNCQHTARGAYYGVPGSPTVARLALLGGAAFLLWAANQD